MTTRRDITTEQFIIFAGWLALFGMTLGRYTFENAWGRTEIRWQWRDVDDVLVRASIAVKP